MKLIFIKTKPFPIMRYCILLLVLLIFSGSTVAQVQQKYSSELNSLWSNGTFIIKISKNGKWAVIEEDFPQKGREILVMQTKGTKQYRLPESEWLDFSADSKWFGCISKEEMILIDLETDKEVRYSNIATYKFSGTGNYIAALQQGKGKLTELLIIDLKNKTIARRLRDVIKFEWHPTQNILLATVKGAEQNQVIRYDVGKENSDLLFKENSGSIEYLRWNGSGSAAIFLSRNEGNLQLHYFSKSEGTSGVLTDKAIQEKFIDHHLSDRQPFISDDGKKVIFYVQKLEKSEAEKSDVQVWNSDDPWITPRMESSNGGRHFLTAWYPQSGEIKPIETEALPKAAMSVNHDFAVVHNPLQYEPLYKYYPNADLYIKNIATGDTTLVCKNQYTEGKFVTISPSGKYVSYFKDTDWFVYNLESGKTINLTEDLEVPFQNTESQRPGDLFPYGNPGWLKDDGYIIFYDQYDIWVLSPEGNTKKRVTQGREDKIQYRISRDYGRKAYNPLTIHPDFWSEPFNIKEGIILEFLDNNNFDTGLALWKDDLAIKPLFKTEGAITKVMSSDNLETVLYSSHRFNRPLSIHNVNVKTKKSQLLYQANEKLLDYDLGHTEFIEYQLEDGTKLRGSLMYPANYNPNIKYPMIVEIYERKSVDINQFQPPSNYMVIGISLLNFTLNDYFVLYPDIEYTIGDPGISALKSVTAAVDKVLETGKVDEKRLGLIGHSFGGYETAFIVTQTDKFAAAVAGAAVTNIVSYYHDVFWDSRRTQMWRMENQQFRFGDSFYNMKDAYYRNSPLHHVENVNTPLLLWTGNTDTNINWNQSVQMFLALKRLGKKSKLLLYDDEPHVLMKTPNQMDLTKGIFNWMEKYVKKIDEI